MLYENAGWDMILQAGHFMLILSSPPCLFNDPE